MSQLDEEERRRLNAYIEALYQNGSLPARKFIDQVVKVIKEKSLEKECNHK
ncbi:MAG: hypothetical protein M3R47_06450 [Chloroflexota bacterium]|nr:hypothetical protein [Chloroflexota bacterium]